MLTESREASFICEAVPELRPRKRRNRRSSDWKNAPTLSCVGCSTAFRPKRTDRLKFCSRDCFFRGLADRARYPSTLVYFKNCAGCSALFAAPKANYWYCSQECWPPRYQRRPKRKSECIGCGREIIGTAAKRRCSTCARRHGRSNHGRKHEHRARKFGVAYEAINPIAVFERDAWRCQMCGIRTPRSLRGKMRPTAPELDHRIPMAMGGTHTWDNVQCSCRACNGKKGATRAYGQMSLFCRVDGGGGAKSLARRV
jgi:hypothetical protein